MASPSSIHAQYVRTCLELTVQSAERVPHDRRLFQARVGKAHPLWLLGHLAWAADMVQVRAVLCETSALDDTFVQRFGAKFAGGLAISGNPAFYPTWDEVLATYQAVMEQCVRGVGGLPPETLERPPCGPVPEVLRPFFTSCERAIVLNVAHDSYHRGQMGMLSRLGG